MGIFSERPSWKPAFGPMVLVSKLLIQGLGRLILSLSKFFLVVVHFSMHRFLWLKLTGLFSIFKTDSGLALSIIGANPLLLVPSMLQLGRYVLQHLHIFGACGAQDSYLPTQCSFIVPLLHHTKLSNESIHEHNNPPSAIMAQLAMAEPLDSSSIAARVALSSRIGIDLVAMCKSYEATAGSIPEQSGLIFFSHLNPKLTPPAYRQWQ